MVFCVDEKTAIQALDRRDRQLPQSLGQAESHGFEYKRNGTLSLFAALKTATGEVVGKTAQRHTSEQFVRFLEEIWFAKIQRYIREHNKHAKPIRFDGSTRIRSIEFQAISLTQ